MCNAVETVLIDRSIAHEFLPKLLEILRLGAVKVRGCPRTLAIGGDDIEAVSDDEWKMEYGALVLAIRVVDGVEQAVGHINQHGSHHTDCIITEDGCNAARFLREVDSAGVFHNVSTRLADGYRYGFGAEVGISTGKLHARGPVGLDGLVTYKYILAGKGQCVSHYVGPQARRFKHELSSEKVTV
jgi:glutamate-5-semialdehyde dehydrogenase